jgi:hypothetical protein
MDATEILKKIHALKNAALFYTGAEFLVMGVYTDRFDRMMETGTQMFVGEYTRKAKLADIEEDMAWTREQNAS